MQDFFTDRKILCSIDGKDINEYVVFKRKGRTSSRADENYVYEALLQDDSKITNGDLVDSNINKYFVVSRRDGYLSKIAQLRKINCSVDLYEITSQYSGNKKVKDVEVLINDNIQCSKISVTAVSKLYDAGLLTDTVLKLLLPKVGIKLDNRIKIDGENFWVTAIDTNDYEGLNLVQVKVDNRVTQ